LIFNDFFKYLTSEQIEVTYHELLEKSEFPEDVLLLHEFGMKGLIKAQDHLRKMVDQMTSNGIP